MIEDPERYLEDFKKAGADYLTVHYETGYHIHRTLTSIRALGMKAGLVYKPAHPGEHGEGHNTGNRPAADHEHQPRLWRTEIPAPYL